VLASRCDTDLSGGAVDAGSTICDLRVVMSPSHSTTDTASRPAVSEARREVLCLWWVHPHEGLTPLTSARTVLGRSPGSCFRLAGTEASRRHAVIERRGGRHTLRDLGSKNGTFVNGQRIVSDTVVGGQDVVRLGEWVAVAVYVPATDAKSDRAVRPLETEGIAGPALNECFQQLKRVAPTNVSTILVGETGTGKEIFARALHAFSGRTGKFIAVNCAEVPEPLAEAELFGCRKGAFTGADRNHLGHLREASGGTLFLDEVCELPPTIQAKLLRAVQDGSVMPLGESRAVEVDVRVVCAAQGPLDEAVAAGRFRPDLYARLNGVEITLPPLRARREEIVPLLVRTLSARHVAAPPLSPALAEWLCLYDWPFNLREVVQTALRFAVQHGDAATLDVGHLPERMTRNGCGSLVSVEKGDGTGLTRAERHRRALSERDDAQLAELVQALRLAAGNLSVAARQCGISRQRAYRLIDDSPDIDVDELRGPVKVARIDVSCDG